MIASWIIGFILILASLGVILARKPVHSGLFFLLMLMSLSVLYLQLSAQFIAVMQVLVYAGAIMVIFMFVIVLFQDAHNNIARHKPQSAMPLLLIGGISIVALFGFLLAQLFGIIAPKAGVSPEFGMVETIGKALYVDFFFPFEAIIFLFLVALVGALYIGKKEI